MGYSDLLVLVSGRNLRCIPYLPIRGAFTEFEYCRYTMVGIVPILYLGYKILKGSKYYKPEEVDLLKNIDEIEEYEANYEPQPARSGSHPAPLHCHVSNEPSTGTNLRDSWIFSLDS